MNLTRCENGHFYDADRFHSCPHCGQADVSPVQETDIGVTVPLDTNFNTVEETATEAGGATIGFWDINSPSAKTEPTVGWVVCIAGEHLGQSFTLKTGRNFVGRSSTMDVCLSKDDSISREKHAIILYEPKANIFLVQPGDSRELFYLNEKVVLGAEQLKAYDILSLGKTKLLFVPCCSDQFRWDMIAEFQ